MTVVETLGPLSWFFGRKNSRNGCPCGRIVVLRSSWAAQWLCRLTRGRLYPLPVMELGRARVATSTLTARLMDAMVQQGPVDPQMEQALLRFFFRDAHILFVCRKNLFQWIQDEATRYEAAWRMALRHQCRRVTFIPTDPSAAKLLRCWDQTREPQASVALEIVDHQLLRGAGMAWNAVWSWLVGIGLLTSILCQMGRQGLVRRLPSRRPFRVALHNHHGSSKRPQDVRFAECLADGQRIRPDDVLLVLSGTTHELRRALQPLNHGIARARLFGPRVPISYLMRLLPRLLRAAAAFWVIRSAPHAGLRHRAAGAIRYGVFLEVLLHHYAFEVLLSAEESFSHHIVETVVLNHWGARTAWIPHSIASRDYTMSYLHYDLLPVQGEFPMMLHGRTWSPRMVVKPVGILWNDETIHAKIASASEAVRAIIDEARRGGRKLLAVLTGSFGQADDFLVERNRRFLTVLAALAEREPNLLMLINPKAGAENARACQFLFQQPFWTILEPWVRQGRMRILDPREGFACSAQDLIQGSDAVVSTSQYAAFNSVWVEALLLGKPSYSFTPSEFRHIVPVPGLFDEWLFDDEDALLNRLQASLHAAPGACRTTDRLQSLFDPYNDGRAFERFREAILTIGDRDQQADTVSSECAGPLEAATARMSA